MAKAAERVGNQGRSLGEGAESPGAPGEPAAPSPAVAADASVHEVATEARPRLVKKILIYMATSTRKLIDSARAGLVEIRGALEHALIDDHKWPEFARNCRRVDVHVLVHGYQVDTGAELGAAEFDYALGQGVTKAAEVGWKWNSPSEFQYIPGDTSILASWMRSKLYPKTEDRAKPSEVDSIALVIWGHGQGVGTDLVLPQTAGAGAISRPTFLNIGGFGDRALAQAVEDGLRPSNKKDAADGGAGAPDQSATTNSLVDLLVFDSCLMAGVELAYQFRRVAKYLIASQSFVNTAPGGPPGLNVSAVVRGFVQRDAWVKASSKGVAGVVGPLLEAGTDIVSVIGDTSSGAQQLTLFHLEGLGEKTVDVSEQVADEERLSADVWLFNALRKPAEIDKHTTALTKLLKPEKGEAPKVRIAGLMRLFARLLREASGEAEERERILFAFRRASFARARQFVDLSDLARQVHQFSRHRLLQLVALALINHLTPRIGGFVAYHRAAVAFQDKPRFGGVAVYCPWFAAQATPGDEPIFDVLVDHDEYHALALNEASEWSSFALGPLYEATAGERQTPRERSQRHAPRACGWGWPCQGTPGCGRGCCCRGGWPWPGGPYPPYPHGPHGPFGFLGPGDKPSGSSLGPGDKPSNGSLGPGDKPSGNNLGTRDDEYV